MADGLTSYRSFICDFVDVHCLVSTASLEASERLPFRFESLVIWHAARTFTKLVHDHAAAFPRGEIFGLTSQMNRASDAIVLLTAEGSGLPTRTLFRHRLGLAQGEIAEVAAATFLAVDRSYINQSTQKLIYDSAQTLARQINAFRKTLG